MKTARCAVPLAALLAVAAGGAAAGSHGKGLRGIGVNYFDAFYRTLRDGNDTSYDAGF